MCAGAALVEVKTDGGQEAKAEILVYIFIFQGCARMRFALAHMP
jgi:hypothetical protein